MPKDNQQIKFKNNINNIETNEIIAEIESVTGITFFSFKDIKKLKVLSIYYLENFVGAIFFNEYNNYIDFKIGFIKETYRNQGYMKLLLEKFLKSKPKEIYCVSKNKYMIRLLLENKYFKIKFIELPIKQIISQILLIFNFKKIKEYIRKRKNDKNNFEFFKRI